MAFEGMVTDREKLQLRMLLNAGESAIVGLAWFLALHVLQEKAQRRVLLLDDPFGGLDANNRAAVLATLRAFARLCAPAFFMVSTHDEGFGDLLEREFGRVGDWPSGVNRVRFERGPDNSPNSVEVSAEAGAPDLAAELARLGFDATAGSAAATVES